LETLWKRFETLWKPFWNTLKPFWNTLKPFGNPLETLWNPLEALLKCFETLSKPFGNALKFFGMRNTLETPSKCSEYSLKTWFESAREKNILLVCVHWRNCVTALHANFFLQKCYFAIWLGTDLFIVEERSKDITHVKPLLSLVAKIADVCECKWE